MVIELNEKQKETLIDFMDEFGDGSQLYKFFKTSNKSKILTMNIKITDENVPYPFNNGWWQLNVNGKDITCLNFVVYKNILKKIKSLN